MTPGTEQKIPSSANQRYPSLADNRKPESHEYSQMWTCSKVEVFATPLPFIVKTLVLDTFSN